MSAFKLSAEDRDFLAHYASLQGKDAEVFAESNRERMAAVYGRVNALNADKSEWLKPRAVTRITVLRCSPRGMSPAPPLSKQHRDLLEKYSSLSGADAIEFFEKRRDDLIAASLAAAAAADDGIETAPIAKFPPQPPPPPSMNKGKENPLIGQFQLRLSMTRVSSGDVLAVDFDYGVATPIRIATIDPASIVRGWQQTFAFNLRQPALEAIRRPDGSLTIVPPKAPAASASTPSALSRFFKKTKP